MKINVLGVQIDKVTQDQTIDQIEKWLKSAGKHYVVTPNIEFIMVAQTDREFRAVLNKADLALPDSARIGWANKIIKSQGFNRLWLWPQFIFPKFSSSFPVTTGTDLMAKLLEESAEKGFMVGFLGGKENVALKLLERLKRKYPKLKVGFATGQVRVNNNGEMIQGEEQIKKIELPLDILFVAFGIPKQEKWMAKNLPRLPVKVMIGVGGAFDYLSGDVSRAPKWIRSGGFEWLYRIIVQPWRISRFWALVKFVFLVLFHK